MAQVVAERVCRQSEDVVLQLLQVVYASYLLHRVWIAEDEIAKTKMFGHQILEILIDHLGVLVDEGSLALVGIRFLVALAGVEHQRHILIHLTNGTQQLKSCQFILLLAISKHRETAIADDAQDIVAIFRIERPCFFVGTCQDNLGASTHTQHLQLRVQRFCGKLQTLLQDKLIEIRKQGRIETDAVLNHKNHLHTCCQVVIQIHLILNQFDDGQQQFRITQPAEHIFEHTQIFILHTARDAMREGSEHHNGECRELSLDASSNIEHIIISRSWHTNDQIKLRPANQSCRILLRSSTEETRRITQTQLRILIKNLFIHTSIIFQHEGIIGIRNNQHIEHALLHQIHKLGLAERGVFILDICHNEECTRSFPLAKVHKISDLTKGKPQNSKEKEKGLCHFGIVPLSLK